MTYTPEFEAAVMAVSTTAAVGYGLGMAFVVFILFIGRSQGGE